MSTTPANLKFAKTHEWARLEKDGTVSIGITDYAQQSLGDIVYIELPEPGNVLTAGQEAGTIESVKAATEFYAPVAGTVIAINQTLADTPEAVNSDCYVAGWLIQITPDDATELAHLMDADAYHSSCEQTLDS